MLLDPGMAVQMGREAAEARMVDACTITRAGAGAPDINETTGKVTPPAPSVIYVGKCEVQVPQVVEQPVASADAEDVVQDAIVKVPVTAVTGNVRVGDTVTITACTFDPALVANTYAVRALHGKSFATARRLRCEEAN